MAALPAQRWLTPWRYRLTACVEYLNKYIGLAPLTAPLTALSAACAYLQDLLEEEVTVFLGRKKSERRAGIDGQGGYRKARTLTLSCGTVVLERPRVRGMGLLTCQGYLVKDQGMTYPADPDPESALAPLQAAACTYRIALGPRAGRKMLTLQTRPSQAAASTTERCVNEQGFSLHAEVRLAINERRKLEHLRRYITRPAIANERLTLNRAGQVVLTLKTPYRDGTTHVVMPPLEFMHRLAALVPRPRLHLIRFHMACSSRTQLRPQIIPSAPSNATDPPAGRGDTLAPAATARIRWAQLLKRRN